MSSLFTKKQFIAILVLFSFLIFPLSVLAVANSTGYAWFENSGWINFAPDDGGGVTVSDTGVTGYLWAENIGWIQLDYDGDAGATNTNSTNWGVTNDGNGNLSGYAWSENAGWISFQTSTSQVIISDGDFSGYAWGENVGWISMSGSYSGGTYGPTTTWELTPGTPALQIKGNFRVKGNLRIK